MGESLNNRAVWLSSFSSPSEVVSLPIPTATQGSAVIRIEATFLTPYTDAKLMHEWRDGSLQQFQKVPLENCFLLNEQRLLGELTYTSADLTLLPVYMVAAGALIEAANIKAGETVVILFPETVRMG
ncbi:unnamed protein product [Alternaria alternata]